MNLLFTIESFNVLIVVIKCNHYYIRFLTGELFIEYFQYWKKTRNEAFAVVFEKPRSDFRICGSHSQLHLLALVSCQARIYNFLFLF